MKPDTSEQDRALADRLVNYADAIVANAIETLPREAG